MVSYVKLREGIPAFYHITRLFCFCLVTRVSVFISPLWIKGLIRFGKNLIRSSAVQLILYNFLQWLNFLFSVCILLLFVLRPPEGVRYAIIKLPFSESCICSFLNPKLSLPHPITLLLFVIIR